MLCITAVEKGQVTGLAVLCKFQDWLDRKNKIPWQVKQLPYAYQQRIYIFFGVCSCNYSPVLSRVQWENVAAMPGLSLQFCLDHMDLFPSHFKSVP